MSTFKVNEDKCIGCMACVRVAKDHFELNGSRKAVVLQQPSDEASLKLVEQALSACPTEAIERLEAVAPTSASVTASSESVILGHHNVRETLERHPELKPAIVELSPKFKSLMNPVMWNSMARFATFETASKVTNVSLCEILHHLNKQLGLEEALLKSFPACIAELKGSEAAATSQIVADIAISLEQAIHDPYVLDVRGAKNDPFDRIIKLAHDTKAGESFTLIQAFKPDPMIKMLAAMDFDYEITKEIPGEVHIRFTKTKAEAEPAAASQLTGDASDTPSGSPRPSLTIQSATPVGYPIIMRLLQSKRLSEHLHIKELKVWEETEKHLAWIVNGRADISFSAVITATKFKNAGVKMPAVFIWDNFVLLTRNTDAKTLSDLKGETIKLPLFEDAPPAKITRYLLESEGLQMSDFNFEYGVPFGRPRELMAAFATGAANHVLLREPEASFAIAAAKANGLSFAELSYGQLFNAATPGFGQFPNAGVIVKESLYETHPEVMKVFEEELQAAIQWVNAHPREAAELSFDMMRSTVDNVESFIRRVHFDYKSGPALSEKMRQFYTVLSEHEVLPITVDDALLEMFR